MHHIVRGGTFALILLTLGLSWIFISYAEVPAESEIVVIGGLTVSNEAPGETVGESQQEAPPKSETDESLDSDEDDTEPAEEAMVSCGIFDITGYCGCEICTGSNEMTYSGTVPKADHTIAADLSVFPLGTRLKIGDCIYTVEDTGTSIKDNKIDIFYDTHEEAVESGRYSMEVFLLK